VATRGQAVIGYAQVGLNRQNRAELFAIYVLPEEQGVGTGRLLWQQAIAHAHTLGQRDMLVWVLATNEPARRFYERQGARLADERPFPIGDSSVAEVCYRATIQ
jgi:ribosomal protein S18 acetylase RimI-like enzyme